jgi:hypothetical protein
MQPSLFADDDADEQAKEELAPPFAGRRYPLKDGDHRNEDGRNRCNNLLSSLHGNSLLGN